MKRLLRRVGIAALVTAAATFMAQGALACDVTQTRIVFPNLGTHIAWYCKATEAEKRQALEQLRAHACIPQRLKEFGKPFASSEAIDLIPYSFTRPDAEKAGPILDARITLTVSTENGNERRTGYRALATGRRVAGSKAIEFDLSDALGFELECPASGCSERYTTLCDN